MKRISIKEKYIKILFVLLMFGLVTFWAYKQPYLPFNRAPDEKMKFDICNYVAQNNKLPHGDDEALRDPDWGISYGFMPILSYMCSAVLMKIVSIFNTSEFAMIFSARFFSVIAYTATVIMVIKISEKLFKNNFKWIFITAISGLPQLMYLGTYINTDMLAIFSTSVIIYSWILGLETKWNKKSCIILAIGIGLCALAYYNAYGYILTSGILFILSYLLKDKNEKNIKEMFKKGFIILGIVLLIAGWWFVRNAIIYNGDFLGLKAESECAEKYAGERFRPENRKVPYVVGESFGDMLIKCGWIVKTYKSFIAVFGNMDLVLCTNKIYLLYTGVFVVSEIGFILYLKNSKKEKNKILLQSIFLANIIIPIILSLYYSYFSDFQPQGRYIMSCVIPLMYFCTLGLKELFEKIIKNEKIRNILINLFSVGIIMMPIYIMFFYVFGKFYK